MIKRNGISPGIIYTPIKKFKMKNLTSFALLFTCFLFTQCSHTNKLDKQNANSEKGLKDYYKKYFPIGVAVSPGDLKMMK